SRTREQTTLGLVSRSSLLPAAILSVKIAHDLENIALAETQIPEHLSIDIREDALVHGLPGKRLGVAIAQVRRDVTSQEELEPVVLGLLRLNSRANLRCRGSSGTGWAG